jgi:hypothetical protein
VNKGAILYSFLSFSSSVDLNHLEQLKIANQLIITLPVKSYLKNLHHLQPATTMTDSTAAITALSAEPALSPIATSTEEPTYASLKRAQQQLNSHATSIHSHGGDGSHGHLALTVSAATYISITGTPFQAPVNPTAQPNHPRGSEGAEITELNRQHLVNQKTYRLYQQTDKSLRNQLITAVPLLYIEDLLDDTIGWGNTTCLQLLDHLWETYGTITAVELEANIATMKEPWNTESPIQTVFTQLKDAIAFSRAGQDPISTATAIRAGYTIISDTGLFETSCREWRNTPVANHTLHAFRLHFTSADRDRRQTATTNSSGYHSSNQASDAKLDAAVATAVALAVKNQQRPQDRNRNRNNTTRSNNNTAPTGKLSWCWTHGTTSNPDHTSSSCNRPAPGHQVTATTSNKMGGNTERYQIPFNNTPRP